MSKYKKEEVYDDTPDENKPDPLEIQYALSKAGEIGRAQARYSWGAVLFALFGYLTQSVEAIGFLSWLSPVGVSLSIMGWFGMGRAGSEAQKYIKELLPDYNYGKYGGAVPFIWAQFYSLHGQGGWRRKVALASYPAAFSACLAYAGMLPVTNYLTDPGYIVIAVCAAILWAVATYQVVGLWKNRLKTMFK